MSLIFSSEDEIKAYQDAETLRRGQQVTITRYGNDVIDCTAFMLEKPRRADIVAEYAGGKDMKLEYDNIPHSEEAHAQLRSIKVGELKLSSSPSPSGAKVPAPIPSPDAAAPIDIETSSATFASVAGIAIGLAGFILLKRLFF